MTVRPMMAESEITCAPVSDQVAKPSGSRSISSCRALKK